MVDLESLVIEFLGHGQSEHNSFGPYACFFIPLSKPRDHGLLNTPLNFPLLAIDPRSGPMRMEAKDYHYTLTLHKDQTETPQASSTRYLLRVVTVVVRTATSFNIVPNASPSDSVYRA